MGSDSALCAPAGAGHHGTSCGRINRRVDCAISRRVDCAINRRIDCAHPQ